MDTYETNSQKELLSAHIGGVINLTRECGSTTAINSLRETVGFARAMATVYKYDATELIARLEAEIAVRRAANFPFVPIDTIIAAAKNYLGMMVATNGNRLKSAESTRKYLERRNAADLADFIDWT